MDDVNLILEGGGMRGIYTSGVLDAFLEKDIFINNIIAVSAGCFNALSYISKQKGRSYKLNTKYLTDSRFISYRRLILKGGAIDNDFIFDEVFKKLDPFDYDSFRNNVGKFLVVSTDMETGQARYDEIKDLDKDVDYIKASSALPLFANMVRIEDLKLVDGGVADSIPILKSLNLGYQKNVLILTRAEDFVMEKNKFMVVIKLRYKKYPNLIEQIEKRYLEYNKTMQIVEKLEKQGKIFVIRPKKDLGILNIEKNLEKSEAIYQQAYQDGLENIENLKKYLARGKEIEIKTKKISR